MSSQNEAHGDEDVLVQPTAHDYKVALGHVVETILDFGCWPRPRVAGHQPRVQFDLYEWLAEDRDPSFMLEMYVAALSNNDESLEIRRIREQKEIYDRLSTHLRGSEIVEVVALDLSRA